jgi:hypothetical protein
MLSRLFLICANRRYQPNDLLTDSASAYLHLITNDVLLKSIIITEAAITRSPTKPQHTSTGAGTNKRSSRSLSDNLEAKYTALHRPINAA